MGFREAILQYIEQQICDYLIIDEPDIPYQNQIAGYEDLNRLRNIESDPGTVLAPDLSGTNAYDMQSFLVPRRPKDHFSTALRQLYCRPIKNFDSTGLRQVKKLFRDREPILQTPTAFLHIISGEKDIYWPQRNRPATSRLNYQVEYLKVAIDCVFRDLSEPQNELLIRPSDTAGEMPKPWLGNGKYWSDQKKACNNIDPIDISGLTGLPMGYQPEYYKTINQQATGFVQDIESLLDPTDIRNRPVAGMPSSPDTAQTFNFGENNAFSADVRNTNLAIWGMLPESGNSPTDTVRCVFELEIHYPKIYS